MDKPIEFWVALCSAALYVYLNAKEKVFHYRLLMVISSAGLGFSLAQDVMEYTGLGLSVSGVALTAFGYVLIDAVTAVISDRNLIKELMKRRFK